MGGFFERLGWEEVSLSSLARRRASPGPGLRCRRGDARRPHERVSGEGISVFEGGRPVHQGRCSGRRFPSWASALALSFWPRRAGRAVTQSPEKERGWYDVQLTSGGAAGRPFPRPRADALRLPVARRYLRRPRRRHTPCHGKAVPQPGIQGGQLRLRSPVPYGSNGRYGKRRGRRRKGRPSTRGRIEEEGAAQRGRFERQAQRLSDNFSAQWNRT